ncbi:MAG: integron integrase, partial [Nitrospirae bacterium]|nr:integron integrase [Nitrospirota bacterium]
MQPIPDDILTPFNAILVKKVVPAALRDDYRKWLRYYLDFRIKYPPPNVKSEQVRLFIEKMRSKGKSGEALNHAAHALSLFFSLQPKSRRAAVPVAKSRSGNTSPVTAAQIRIQPSEQAARDAVPVKEPAAAVTRTPFRRPGRKYNEWWSLERTPSPEWDEAIAGRLAGEIKARHYSRKTLKAYADWSRKFQLFLKHKPPVEVSSADVRAYLTYLAVTCKVSASTQNQAFNSLLFLFRHILQKDFGDHKDVPRAKPSSYIPVVLSRQEIDAVLRHLKHPDDLVVKLLYGCGLRLFECLKVRVQNFNVDEGVLTVMDGKGKKARTVPIPQMIMQELLAQFERVKAVHDEDLKAGYAGVLLDDALDRKYRNAAKDIIWQWFFPQQNLTFIAETNEMRRFHLSDKDVQPALYEAVRKARITKRVTSHTFRHSFATHLLQANYDIRTIQ